MGSRPQRVIDLDAEMMREALMVEHGILVGHDTNKKIIAALFQKAEAEDLERKNQAAKEEEESSTGPSSDAATHMCIDCWGVVLTFCGFQALYAACTACQQLRHLADESKLFSQFISTAFTPSTLPPTIDPTTIWRPECQIRYGKHKGMELHCSVKSLRQLMDEKRDGWYLALEDDFLLKYHPNVINISASQQQLDLTVVPWSQYWSVRRCLVDFECKIMNSVCKWYQSCVDLITNSWVSIYKSDMRRWAELAWKYINEHLQADEEYVRCARRVADASTCLASAELQASSIAGRSYLDLYYTAEMDSPIQAWAHIEANRHAGMLNLAHDLAMAFDFYSVPEEQAKLYDIPCNEEAVRTYMQNLRYKCLDGHGNSCEYDIMEDGRFPVAEKRGETAATQDDLPQKDVAPQTSLFDKDLGSATCGRRTLKKRRAQLLKKDTNAKK